MVEDIRHAVNNRLDIRIAGAPLRNHAPFPFHSIWEKGLGGKGQSSAYVRLIFEKVSYFGPLNPSLYMTGGNCSRGHRRHRRSLPPPQTRRPGPGARRGQRHETWSAATFQHPPRGMRQPAVRYPVDRYPREPAPASAPHPPARPSHGSLPPEAAPLPALHRERPAQGVGHRGAPPVPRRFRPPRPPPGPGCAHPRVLARDLCKVRCPSAPPRNPPRHQNPSPIAMGEGLG